MDLYTTIGEYFTGVSIQKSTYGSKWYYGNFTLGLEINSHPRFLEVCLCCFWFDVVFYRRHLSLRNQ